MTKGIFLIFILLCVAGVLLFGFGSGNIFSLQRENLNTVSNTISSSTEVSSTTSPQVKNCRVTGCSSQICAEKDVVTDCMYREEYVCYQKAKCERQLSGDCGWSISTDIAACLQQYE